MARRTDIARTTLQTMGSRDDHNSTFATVEKIRRAQEVPLNGVLELIDDPPKPKRAPKRKRRP